MSESRYDYIIAGAGLSGLSLAWRILHTPALQQKRILVADRDLSAPNSKTWSFWHRQEPPFRELIYKSWNQVEVSFKDTSLVRPIEEYTYHSIHSGDFRSHVIEALNNSPQFDLLEAPIRSLEGTKEHATLSTSSDTYTAEFIFQSCLKPPSLKHDQPHYPLIQHFLGWEIEANRDVFDPSTITLMDFDPNFSGGIAFIYILPQTKRKALLEYTVFSDTVRERPFYEDKLNIYLNNKYSLRPFDYTMIRTEYGEIPMQDHRYAPFYAPSVMNMGTVGGLTKPSTGYTFSRIQRDVQDTVESLQRTGTPSMPYRSAYRYRAYDLWLLYILHEHPGQAQTVFRQLFTNNTMDEVFRFLSEENTLMQDMKTMSRVSYGPFLRAMWKTRKRLMKI